MDEHDLLTTRLTKILRKQVLSLRSREMIRLTPERELAEELKVSRQSLRRAIKNLIYEGSLVQKHGSGTYIVPELSINSIHLIKAPDIKRDDPFYMVFLSEISNRVAIESIPLLIVNENSIPKFPGSTPLIILGYLRKETYELVRDSYKNIIAVQSHPAYKDITQVDVNYYRIGYEAVVELVKHNHENVLHLAGPEEYPAAVARRRGFEDALKDTGINGQVVVGKMNWKYGYMIASEIWNEYVRKKGISGVFVANDWMAIGLINKLTEMGVRIPEDISIIGCDDIQMSGEIIPGLSTFKEDFQLLISTVYANINEMHFSKDYSNKQLLLPAKFIKRASLRAL